MHRTSCSLAVVPPLYRPTEAERFQALHEVQQAFVALRYALYDFEIRFVQRSVLPVYKGSTIRGAILHAFVRSFCDCAMEPNKHGPACLYNQVFEKPMLDQDMGPLVSPSPRAFFQPPASRQRVFKPNETLTFRVGLFAPVRHIHPFLVAAVQNMGEHGLGAQRGQGRGRFALERVTSPLPAGQSITVWTPDSILPEEGHLWDVYDVPWLAQEQSRIHLDFTTPLRTKHRGRLMEELADPKVLVRLLLRRLISQLPEPQRLLGGPVLRSLLDQAKQIRLSEVQMNWSEWERYSSRHRSRMKLGGLVGSLTLDAVSAPLVWLFRMAERIGVGKCTSFGLGQFRMEVLPAHPRPVRRQGRKMTKSEGQSVS